MRWLFTVQPVPSNKTFLPPGKAIRLAVYMAESIVSETPDLPVIGAAIAIRPATPRDIPALLAIEERSFETDRMSRRSFQHLLLRANADCLVATSGGSVVGYFATFYRRTIPTGRLHSLAVDPRTQGSGIGRTLLSHAEKCARKQRMETLRLAVRIDNPAAIALYRMSGYREIGTEKNYYSDGATALKMEKTLAGG